MLYAIKEAVNVNERKLISRLEIERRFGVKAKRLEDFALVRPRFVKLISRRYAIEYFLLAEVLQCVKALKTKIVCKNRKQKN